MFCTCNDKDSEYHYMVKDEVWLEAVSSLGIKKEELLCINCLEKGLNRQVQLEDFKYVPLNCPSFDKKRTDKLKERLEGFKCEHPWCRACWTEYGLWGGKAKLLSNSKDPDKVSEQFNELFDELEPRLDYNIDPKTIVFVHKIDESLMAQYKIRNEESVIQVTVYKEP